MILALFYMTMCVSIAICCIDIPWIFYPFLILGFVSFCFASYNYEGLKKRIESLEKRRKDNV
jgi:hypothetical protein